MRHSLNTIARHIYCLQNRTRSFMPVFFSFWCGCIRHTTVSLKPNTDCSKSVEHIVGDERKDFDCEALERKARNHYCTVEKKKAIIGGSCHKYHFCRDKGFVPQIFVATNTCLSRQAYLCCDKRRVLSRQIHVCRDKSFDATKIILVAAPANDKKHVDFVLNERGLQIYQAKKTFLACCVDGLVSCSCDGHSQKLVESKCPYALSQKSAKDAARQRGCQQSISTSEWRLCGTSEYYYHIQTHLFLYGFSQRDLVMYTFAGDSCCSCQVQYSKEFAENMVSKAENFYRSQVVSVLLYGRTGSTVG